MHGVDHEEQNDGWGIRVFSQQCEEGGRVQYSDPRRSKGTAGVMACGRVNNCLGEVF